MGCGSVGRTATGLNAVDRIVGEQQDFLPQLVFFPTLSDQEVERFVALGDEGQRLAREGRPAEAEAAFRGQATIYPPNPDPYVSLALLAASRDDRDAALEHLRAAVVRGFTDLGLVGRAEVWSRLRSASPFLLLQDAVPRLVEAEEAWAGWGTMYTGSTPASATSVVRAHEMRRADVVRMAPALGARQVRLWNRLIDRSAAELLRAYVVASADAPDVETALDRILEIHAQDTVLRWERVPYATASQLGQIAALVLDERPSPEHRAGGLVLRALSLWGRSDAPPAATVDTVRACLDEVLDRYADSPYVGTAAEGRVRIELDTGDTGRAAVAYRAVRSDHPELLGRLQEFLGVDALRLGGIPDLRLESLDGTVIDRTGLTGKIVVWDFWATWCEPCREEFPTLRQLDRKFGDEVALVGVSLDDADLMSHAMLREWIAREELPGNQVHDGKGWDSDLVRAFGVREIPFTVVATASGEVLAVGAHGKKLLAAVAAARN